MAGAAHSPNGRLVAGGVREPRSPAPDPRLNMTIPSRRLRVRSSPTCACRPRTATDRPGTLETRLHGCGMHEMGRYLRLATVAQGPEQQHL